MPEPVPGPTFFLTGFLGGLMGGRGSPWNAGLDTRPIPSPFPQRPGTPPISGGPEAPRRATSDVVKYSRTPYAIVKGKVAKWKKSIEQYLDENPEARDAILGVAAYYAQGSGRAATMRLYKPGRAPPAGSKTSQRGGLPATQPRPQPLTRPRRTPRSPQPSRRARPQRPPAPKLPPARRAVPGQIPLPVPQPTPGRPAPAPAPQPSPVPTPTRTAPRTSPRPDPRARPRPGGVPSTVPLPAPAPLRLPAVKPLRFPAIRPFLPLLPSFALPSGVRVPKPLTKAADKLRTASQIGTLLLPADQPWAMPQVAYDYDRDKCECPKPKRKPRQPRKVCYEGKFKESSFSTSKSAKKEIPCQ